MADIADFRAQWQPDGLAKTNRFQCLVFPPTAVPLRGIREYLRFNVTEAELAGQSLNTEDIRYYGPIFRAPHQAMFSDLTLTFLTSSDMRERDFFNRWFNFIIGDGSYDFAFREDYITSLIVEKLNEFGKSDMVFKIKQAYPVNVMPIPMSWADDGFVRTAVQFSYTDIEIITPENS